LHDHVRQQVDIVERALAKIGKVQRPVPFTYAAWGLVGTVFNLAYAPWQLIAAHQDAFFLLGDILTVAAVAITGIEYFRATMDRRTAMDVQSLATFGLVANVLWIVKIPLMASGAVSGLAYGFIYSMGIAIALVVHGAGPTRPLMYGGIFLLGATVFASMHVQYASYAFSIGNFVALVVPALYLAFAARHVDAHG